MRVISAVILSENYLDRKVVEGVDDIISCAKAMINEHVKITFDPTLVRGMGYYTGTILRSALMDIISPLQAAVVMTR